MNIIITRVFENEYHYHNDLGQKMTARVLFSYGQNVSIEKVYLPMGDTLTHAMRKAVFRACVEWFAERPQSPKS